MDTTQEIVKKSIYVEADGVIIKEIEKFKVEIEQEVKLIVVKFVDVFAIDKGKKVLIWVKTDDDVSNVSNWLSSRGIKFYSDGSVIRYDAKFYCNLFTCLYFFYVYRYIPVISDFILILTY